MRCILLKSGKVVEAPAKTVLCLGNFDGVHLGHQALLRKVLQEKAQHFPDAHCGVFVFEKPSGDYFVPNSAGHLSTGEEQSRLFTDAGMEYLFIEDFPAIRNLTPEQFVNEILKGKAHCVAPVCGYNYNFGKDRAGTPKQLLDLFGGQGSIVEEVMVDGQSVSSTRIRSALLVGNVKLASRLLGRPYSLTAEVLHGKELGRKIGLPTINQNFSEGKLIPATGVYISECLIDGIKYGGVSNIGSHPTVDNHAAVNCETHLLDYSGDLYGKMLTVRFLEFLREEKKFSSIEDLSKQIRDDCKKAEDFYKTY